MDLASPAVKNNSIPDRGCNSLIKSEQNELPLDLLSGVKILGSLSGKAKGDMF